MKREDRRPPFRHSWRRREDGLRRLPGGHRDRRRAEPTRAAGAAPGGRLSLLEAEVDRIYPEAIRLETVLLGSADWRTRRRIRRVLQDEGYVVHETASGDDLILRAGWKQPSVIVMDLDLRAIDGWEAARHLRRNLATDSIPLIAIHDEASEITRRRLRQAGFSGVLTTPLLDADLLTELDRVLASARWRGHVPQNGGGDESE